ncbi:unnamed protein product [Effrenium voratum]|nr:unnamed protein product [Effrenium voratum]
MRIQTAGDPRWVSFLPPTDASRACAWTIGIAAFLLPRFCFSFLSSLTPVNMDHIIGWVDPPHPAAAVEEVLDSGASSDFNDAAFEAGSGGGTEAGNVLLSL